MRRFLSKRICFSSRGHLVCRWRPILQQDIPPALLIVVILTGLLIILVQIFLVQHTYLTARSDSRSTVNVASNYFQANMMELNLELRALVRQRILSVESHAQQVLKSARRLGRRCRCQLNVVEENSTHIDPSLRHISSTIDLSHHDSDEKMHEEVKVPAAMTLTSAQQLSGNTTARLRQRLPRCDASFNKYQGRLHRSSNHFDYSVHSLNFPMLGGSYSPKNCHPRHSLAVVIPYRDRADHLRILLAHLHLILQRQQQCYRIVVVEQNGTEVFNKAMLMNAAVLEILRFQWIDCFIFHDVDMVPEDDRIPYNCPNFPRHMSVALNKHNYQLLYEDLVGGVLAFPTHHFLAVNGYSNLFWGWGGEDDDMAIRIKTVKLMVTRPNPNIARYTMIEHGPRFRLPLRHRLIYLSAKRYPLDGLNSIRYKLLHVKLMPLYTHLLIDVGPAPRRIHLQPITSH